MADDETSRRELRDKLIFSTVDKVVFGLLIAFAGLVLNLVLENYRAGQETRAEIARLRVDRVAAVSRALDEQQRAIEDFNADTEGQAARADEALLLYLASGRLPADLVPLRPDLERLIEQGRRREKRAKQLEQSQLAARKVLDENRFWIGERAYPDYLRYASTQHELVRASTRLSDVLPWPGVVLRGVANRLTDGLSEAEARATIERSRRQERRELQALHQQYMAARAGLNSVRAKLEASRVDVFSVMTDLE
jgi:hypothetical protein